MFNYNKFMSFSTKLIKINQRNLHFANCLKNEVKFQNFNEEFSQNLINLSTFQRVALGLGSAAVSLMDPNRADMIFCMAETTGINALQYMKSEMLKSPEGSKILKTQPRINSSTVDLEKLKSYPVGTMGRIYSDFLIKNKVTPDSRSSTQFINDIELAYVMQRYREIHDLIHATLSMPTTMLGEVTVKWVEAIQFRLPMCIGGAIFGPIRLKPKHRQLYKTQYLPWAIKTGYNCKFLLNIHFEKRWEQPISEIHKEFNIERLVVQKNSSKNETKAENSPPKEERESLLL